jgi:hypothetical protein
MMCRILFFFKWKYIYNKLDKINKIISEVKFTWNLTKCKKSLTPPPWLYFHYIDFLLFWYLLSDIMLKYAFLFSSNQISPCSCMWSAWSDRVTYDFLYLADHAFYINNDFFCLLFFYRVFFLSLFFFLLFSSLVIIKYF